MKLYVGDLIFPIASPGFISSAIRKITKSEFSHVGMVYDKNWIFEAHMGKNTRLNPMAEYEGKKFRVLRPKLSNIEKARLKDLMEEFNGTFYSPWDIGTNFAFSWLKPARRRAVVDKLGSKKMMICSELVARMLYTVDPKQFALFKEYGGFQPVDVFMQGLSSGMKEIEEAAAVPAARIDVVPEV